MTTTSPTSEIPRWDITWPALLAAEQRPRLAELLLAYARDRRWFRAKARTPRAATLADLIPLDASNLLGILRVTYETGEDDLYAVPIGHVEGPSVEPLEAGGVHAIIARLPAGDGAGALVTALVDGLLVPGHAADALFALLRAGGRASGEHGEVRGEADALLGPIAGTAPLPARIPRAEQTNSAAMFGDRVLLKIYRQLTAGPNPELELGRYLTTACEPPCAPRVLGALSYHPTDQPAADQPGTEFSLGIAHEFLRNDGDAWTLALRELRAAFDRTADRTPPPAAPVRADALSILMRTLEPEIHGGAGAFAAFFGAFLPRAATLGRRTGELHLALASAPTGDPDFAAEPLSVADRGAMVQRTEAMLNAELDALPALLPRLAPPVRALGERLLDPSSRRVITARLGEFRDRAIDVAKTRTHGDLHLGQVLCRDDDFVIVDFEGEPARPLSDRRAKSSPLRDVMGMIRSFDYAPHAVLRDPAFRPAGPEQARRRELWAALWTAEVTAAYLRSYLATTADAPFIPHEPHAHEQLAALLEFHELEKVIYEIRYEANNRPDWIEIPLRGLAAIAGVR